MRPAKQRTTRFTHRAAMPTLTSAAFLVAALATGSPVFLLSALLGLSLVAFAFVSVMWAAHTLTVTSLLSDTAVQRGDDVQLEIGVRCACLLPIAPMRVVVTAGPDRPEQTVRLAHAIRRQQTLRLPFHASHVGVTAPGVKAVELRDLLGLFSVEKTPSVQGGELLVLPLPFDVGELTYAPGDSTAESMARASEDITSPAEIRTYQQGDEMKKIHWKLSARKQELLVRRYEAPVMPDALVLLDCSAPPRQSTGEDAADLRDALLETAASVMRSCVQDGHPAKLPIHGDHPIELDKGMGLPMILEALARVDFTAPDKFERMLHIEMRRMRKVGCTVVVAARLNSRMVDVMVSMRRMGPCLRLYLITFDPDDPALLPMIARLQHAMIEVCYVTPVAL